MGIIWGSLTGVLVSNIATTVAKVLFSKCKSDYSMSQLPIVFKIKPTLLNMAISWMIAPFLFTVTSDHTYVFFTRYVLATLAFVQVFQCSMLFPRTFVHAFPSAWTIIFPHSHVTALESSHPGSGHHAIFPSSFITISSYLFIYLYDYLINIWVPFQNTIVRGVGTRFLLLTIKYCAVSLVPGTEKNVSMPQTTSKRENKR